MDKIQILAIGANPEILQTVLRLINNNPAWNGTGAGPGEEAIEKFHRQPFDVVLLTNGITDEEEKKLRKIFRHQHTHIIIIQHYGGGSGLLSNEIQEALQQRAVAGQPIYTFKDDIFKKE